MMDDNKQATKKGKMKWKESYSRISSTDAQERLGVEFRKLDSDAIPVRKMLAEARYTIDENNKDIQEAKRQVYKAILLEPSLRKIKFVTMNDPRAWSPNGWKDRRNPYLPISLSLSNSFYVFMQPPMSHS